LYVVSWLFGSVLLPELSRRFISQSSLRGFVQHWTRLIVAITVPLTLLGMIVGVKVVPLLFGQTFEQTGTLFVIMATATPLIFINSLYVNWGIASSRSRVYFGAYLIASVLGWLLSLTLCKFAGNVGVAVAMVIRELLIWVMLVFRMGDSKSVNRKFDPAIVMSD
jgi:O-antigen/teichoic acid export membrane protein